METSIRRIVLLAPVAALVCALAATPARAHAAEPQANREADRLNRIMRDYPPQTTALNRRWVVGQGGEMYHFDFFDPMADRFSHLRVYHLDPKQWRLKAMTYADDAIAADFPHLAVGIGDDPVA